MEATTPDERVKMDSMEVWEFINEGGGGMGMMGMKRNYLAEGSAASV
jgi:hypothetical protein